jgi:hypothetical protein
MLTPKTPFLALLGCLLLLGCGNTTCDDCGRRLPDSGAAHDSGSRASPDGAQSPSDAGHAQDAGKSAAEDAGAAHDAGRPLADQDASAPGPISECPGAQSIDRYESWQASGEGQTVPATGSILAGSGDDVRAEIEFVANEWHVLPVLTANVFEGEADFSKSQGFWLTYSATDALYVQIRPSFAWDGGDKYLTPIPGTGGQLETHFFSFAKSAWTTLPDQLGTPSYTYEKAIAQVRGFVFVGETPNKLVFEGLRVDGYDPPCM